MEHKGNADGFDLPNVLSINLDDSLPPTKRVRTIEATHLERELRYACRLSSLRKMIALLDGAIPRLCFLGNGDFHHLSYSVIRAVNRQRVHVVIFDNHPDNMFFPLGIHCGSWVYHVARLPHVARVSVIGITSADLDGVDALQNRLSVLRSGRVAYYCLRPIPRLLSLFAGNAIQDIRSQKERLPDFVGTLVTQTGLPVYLSVDKDVCRREDLPSTWDQGILTAEDLLNCIRSIAPRVLTADVVGDISSYARCGIFKRWLRRLDGRGNAMDNLTGAQAAHAIFNENLISLLGRG